MNDLDLLAAYRATTWTLELPGGLAQLRLDTAASLHPRPLGIITAYNPASAPCPREANRAAHEELRRELERAGALLYCAVAHGTGEEAERWTEPGFAVAGVELPLLVALGERFGQNAIVWVDEAGEPALVVTRAGFCGAEVGEILPTSAD
jgi:hypothetical protein